jgi:hypothetical protein
MFLGAGILRRIELAGALALLPALVLAACGDRPEGGATVASDGAAGDAGAAGDVGSTTDAATDVSCGDRVGILWDALEDAELGNVRLGACVFNETGTTGALVFDGEGGLIGVTGRFRSDAPAQSDWLAMFANDRFPCFAGQTVKYSCTAD